MNREEAREYTNMRGRNTRFWVNQKDFSSPHYYTLKRTRETIKSSLLSNSTVVFKPASTHKETER